MQPPVMRMLISARGLPSNVIVPITPPRGSSDSDGGSSTGAASRCGGAKMLIAWIISSGAGGRPGETCVGSVMN